MTKYRERIKKQSEVPTELQSLMGEILFYVFVALYIAYSPLFFFPWFLIFRGIGIWYGNGRIDGMCVGCRSLDQYEGGMLKYMLAVGCPPGAASRSHIADVLIAVGKEIKRSMSRLTNSHKPNSDKYQLVAFYLSVCGPV